MPCFKWAKELTAEKAHAIASDKGGTARALCGRTLDAWTPAKGDDPRCEPCSSRDEDIHRHADHRSSAPRPARPKRATVDQSPARGPQPRRSAHGATTAGWSPQKGGRQ